MPAAKDLEIYQGDDWSMSVRLRTRDASGVLGPYLNLAGSVGKAQVRPNPDSQEVSAEMAVAVGDQSATPGLVTLSMSSAQTTLLAGIYAWDFQLTSSTGKVTTYLAGSLLCDKQVTR